MHTNSFITYKICFCRTTFRASAISIRDFSLIATKAHLTGFKRPFTDWDEDSNLTNKQKTYTWGDDNFVDEIQGISEMESIHFVVPETGARIFRHNLILSDGNFYQLGARDLLEYIAHKIEGKHWLVDDTPDLPYRTIDFIFDFKELSHVCEKTRVAISEFSLHNDNPINQFLFIIDWIVANFGKDVLGSYEKVKEILLGTTWNSTGDFHETMLSKTNRRLNDIHILLQDRFNRGSYSDIGRWLDCVNEYATNNMQGKLYFSEIYDLDFDSFIAFLSNVFSEIGIPLIFNNKKECFSFLPDAYDHNQFIQFFVAREFMDYATTTEQKCSLFEYCTANDNGQMNNDCQTNPIARGRQDELCPFGQLVKLYDLHKIT